MEMHTVIHILLWQDELQLVQAAQNKQNQQHQVGGGHERGELDGSPPPKDIKLRHSPTARIKPEDVVKKKEKREPEEKKEKDHKVICKLLGFIKEKEKKENIRLVFKDSYRALKKNYEDTLETKLEDY